MFMCVTRTTRKIFCYSNARANCGNRAFRRWRHQSFGAVVHCRINKRLAIFRLRNGGDRETDSKFKFDNFPGCRWQVDKWTWQFEHGTYAIMFPASVRVRIVYSYCILSRYHVTTLRKKLQWLTLLEYYLHLYQ